MQNIQPFIPGEREQVVSVGSDILGPSSPFILLCGCDVVLPREARACDGLLPKNRLSNNVGGVKHDVRTRLHALVEERHFALVDGLRFPTLARF